MFGFINRHFAYKLQIVFHEGSICWLSGLEPFQSAPWSCGEFLIEVSNVFQNLIKLLSLHLLNTSWAEDRALKACVTSWSTRGMEEPWSVLFCFFLFLIQLQVSQKHFKIRALSSAASSAEFLRLRVCLKASRSHESCRSLHLYNSLYGGPWAGFTLINELHECSPHLWSTGSGQSFSGKVIFVYIYSQIYKDFLSCVVFYSYNLLSTWTTNANVNRVLLLITQGRMLWKKQYFNCIKEKSQNACAIGCCLTVSINTGILSSANYLFIYFYYIFHFTIR